MLASSATFQLSFSFRRIGWPQGRRASRDSLGFWHLGERVSDLVVRVMEIPTPQNLGRFPRGLAIQQEPLERIGLRSQGRIDLSAVVQDGVNLA